MNRDELLTKLAMDLGEWYFGDFYDPSTDHKIPKLPKEVVAITHKFEGAELTLDAVVGEPIKEQDWLQRRTELINRPSWSDAPEWAQWMAQCGDGIWRWLIGDRPMCMGRHWWPVTGKWCYAANGKLPTGHNWRDTLERRPQDLHDAQYELGNDWARDRRAVIDEMALEVCPTQWREGGSMRYKGHTITWGEHVTRRHEIEDEEEWPEERCMDCGAPEDGPHERFCAKRSDIESSLSRAMRELNPTTSSLTYSQAKHAARETGICSDGSPCGSPHNPDDDQYCIGCPHEPTAHDCPRCGGEWWSPPHSYCPCEDAPRQSKYHREIKPGVFVDVYDVLAAWDVANPALQHLIKKALQPGDRGHKTIEQDMDDIVASAKRARELVG